MIKIGIWLDENQKKLNMLRQEDEQKLIIKKITYETDEVIDQICNILRKQSNCFEEYLVYLDKVNKGLLQGIDLKEIIRYLGGENIMPNDYFTANDLLKLKYCTSRTVTAKVNVEIVDVNIIVLNKVVEVTFSDGTKEKSVCREPDVFSLEQAISICISKKIMGGSGAYNNTVKRGIKVYDDKLKQEEADKVEQERIAKKRAKRLAYKERRAAEREQVEKERQIEIQKEAYIRAMEYMQNQGA